MKPAKGPTISRLTLTAETASDLMTANPLSIHVNASVREAIALMTDHGFSAAPVIDEAGRPVGVVTSTDILVHDREQVHHANLEDRTEWDIPPAPMRSGFSIEVVDPTLVGDMMTPLLFSVSLNTPAREVVERMLAMRVHHLFVVDDDGVLVGVISSVDILRHLGDTPSIA